MPGRKEIETGYRRFRTETYKRHRERYDELATGQNPDFMVISCSDSRVSPSIILDARPGELFMVRNVANLVPPFDPSGGLHGVSAALEFAVTQLEVSDILILGHGGCGGCQAAYTRHFHGKEPGEGHFIASWVALLDEASARVREEHDGDGGDAALLAMEYAAVRLSLTNLLSFPFVRERVEEGRLALHGGHFAIADGVLRLMDGDGTFRPVKI